MANLMSKAGKQSSLPTSLDRGVSDDKTSKRAKRLAQHQHWMRVMMAGKATPDLKYQKPTS